MAALLRLAGLVAAILTVFALGVAAALHIAELPESPTVQAPVTLTVSEGSIEEVYSIRVDVSRGIDIEVPYTGGPGTITGAPDLSLDGTATRIESGSVVVTVDAQPVVVLEGQMPAYRGLEQGDEGPDVAQLQNELERQGLLAPGSSDGRFGVSTADAVEQWWRSLGISDRRAAPRGTVIFLPTLPRLVAAADDIQLGGLITPGGDLLQVLSTRSELSAELTDLQQRRWIADGASFTAMVGTQEVALSAEQLETIQGEARLQFSVGRAGRLLLEGVDAKSQSTVQVPGQMTVTPQLIGTKIPWAAIRPGGDNGDSTVRLADGTSRTISVLARVGGEAIVRGVEPGQTIVIEAGAPWH